MKEKDDFEVVDFDEHEVLEERTKEIENCGSFLQLKITQQTIPDDLLTDLINKNNEDGISLSTLSDRIGDFVNENQEYTPIINFIGKEVSAVDNLAFLLLAKDIVEQNITNECLKIVFDGNGRFSIDGGDE